jgi:formate dehydrogenase subunit gamma
MSTLIDGNDTNIRRFHPFRIVEHYIAMFTFALLTTTGLSQKFHQFELSQWIIMNLGGITCVRLIHRYTGLVFTIAVLAHIGVALVGLTMRNWPASMIITKKDFTDAIHNMQYYFGLTNRPALCDRYDYKQKFEYWGVVIGGVLMIMTGLTLWFPTSVARWLPGELIPAAKAAHTNEALLAFLVIITWHIYNSVFSPEVFPLDTSILLTGHIYRERMVHEHPIELARIEGRPLEEIIAHHDDEQSGMEFQNSPPRRESPPSGM